MIDAAAYEIADRAIGAAVVLAALAVRKTPPRTSDTAAIARASRRADALFTRRGVRYAEIHAAYSVAYRRCAACVRRDMPVCDVARVIRMICAARERDAALAFRAMICVAPMPSR